MAPGPEELRVLGVVALDDIVHVHEVDRVGRPLVRTAHVGELTGGRLLVDLEGQRALRAAVDGVADLDALAVGQRQDIEVIQTAGAREVELRAAEILAGQRGAALDAGVAGIELAADDTVNGDVGAAGGVFRRQLTRDAHGAEGRAGGVQRVGVIDIDHKLAVHLTGRAVCREGDGHGVLRRGAARDEADVFQQVRAGRDAVGLAADLAGAGRAALVQRAVGIAVRAEGHGAQTGAVDALEVADDHLLLLVGRDMVFDRACAGHDIDRAGRDLALPS